MKTTLQDIAKELNITVSAVSKALSNHPAMSDATKEEVRKTALRLNYRQNKIALSLRSGRSFVIGVIIPSAEKNFFGSVVHGIEKVLNQNGYSLLLFQSNESYEYEKKGIDTFLQFNVDGIIASIAKETTNFDHYLEIKRKNIPLILFDRANETLNVPTVTIDDYKGGFLATEHLILNGYNRIVHIAGLQHIRIFNERLLGYVDALKKYNIPVDDDLIVFGKNSIDSGKECTKRLLESKTKFDAIFAVEDFTALGAMQCLKSHGILIPKEVGIVGFANEAFSGYISPELSTIDQQTSNMGEESANLFIQLKGKHDIYNGKPRNVILQPILIARKSSLKSEV